MTTTTPRPTAEAPPSGDPRLDADVSSVDIQHLSRVLLGHYPELRLAARTLMTDERLHKIDGLTLAEHRERVLGQLRLLVEHGDVHRSFPTRFGGAEDHGGFLARFEELTHADPSLQIKSGVQWGLFASAIYHLGKQFVDFFFFFFFVPLACLARVTCLLRTEDLAILASLDSDLYFFSSRRRSSRNWRINSSCCRGIAIRPPHSSSAYYGRFNAGLVVLRRSPEALAAVEWWRAQSWNHARSPAMAGTTATKSTSTNGRPASPGWS